MGLVYAARFPAKVRRLVLAGAPIDIAEFLQENDFSPEDLDQIATLQVGESMKFGGGAAPIFVLGREPDAWLLDSAA